MAIFATHALDWAKRAQLSRQAQAGRLRRLHEGIYTDDLASPPEAIMRREHLALAALLVPEGLVSHRSALEPGLTAKGELFMTGPYRRRLALPGATFNIQKGTGRQIDDIRVPTAGRRRVVAVAQVAVFHHVEWRTALQGRFSPLNVCYRARIGGAFPGAYGKQTFA
jgi:hypothetical protein